MGSRRADRGRAGGWPEWLVRRAGGWPGRSLRRVGWWSGRSAARETDGKSACRYRVEPGCRLDQAQVGEASTAGRRLRWHADLTPLRLAYPARRPQTCTRCRVHDLAAPLEEAGERYGRRACHSQGRIEEEECGDARRARPVGAHARPEPDARHDPDAPLEMDGRPAPGRPNPSRRPPHTDGGRQHGRRRQRGRRRRHSRRRKHGRLRQHGWRDSAVDEGSTVDEAQRRSTRRDGRPSRRAGRSPLRRSPP